MKGRLFWRMNSVWRTWLQSYAIVLLIPVILMAIAYMQTLRIVEAEVHRANGALLSQLQQEIDSYMDYAYRMAELISLNPKITSILRNQQEVGWQEKLWMVEALSDFRSYNLAKRHVEHFYIYFHGGDFVLTDSSYYTAEMYHGMNLRTSGISLQTWREQMSRQYRGQFFSERDLMGETASGIVYLQSLAVFDRSLNPTTLVIKLNEERLLASMRNIQSYNEGRVYILDENGRMMASSEGVGEAHDFSALEGKTERMGTVIQQWGGEEVVLSYIRSSPSNWKYVYALPSHLYSEKARDVRNVAWLTLALTIVAGSLIAVVLARRNYDPLKRLVRNVAQWSKQRPAGEERANEYDYLAEAIESTMDRNHSMNRMIEKQKLTLRSNLLARLLKGKLAQSYPLEELLPEHDIHLDTGDCAVMLIYLEDYSGFFRQNEQDEEKKRELVQLIITNIVEELAAQHHRGWMTEVDDLLACLISFRPGIPAAEALDEVKRMAEEAQRFIGHRFHILFTASVSAVHRAASELPTAYQEALEAMEYRMLPGARSILWYDQIKHQELSYTYSLEKEQQLINYVNAGDYDKAKMTLDSIIDSNLSQGNLSVDMIRCLLFDICSTMMKLGMGSAQHHPELYEDNREAIRELLNGSTVSAMRERMAQFLHKVCGYTQTRRQSGKLQIKENVETYIAEHYQDQNLSITTISEQLSIHPSHLSRSFKEQAGENLTEYLTKYRVEQAKGLLQQEDVLIKDISEQVGFYNVNTFIRSFKKYEGVTPSAYREAASGNLDTGA